MPFTIDMHLTQPGLLSTDVLLSIVKWVGINCQQMENLNLNLGIYDIFFLQQMIVIKSVTNLTAAF